MCVACVAAHIAGDASAPTPASGPDAPFPDTEGPLPDSRGPLGGRMTWTGVAGFRVEIGDTAIAFDPFVSRPRLRQVLFRGPRIDREAVHRRFSGQAAVFVGHTHYDHAMDLIAVAEASPDARFHGSRVTIELLRRQGLPPHRLVQVEDASTADVGPFRVLAVAAEHGVVPVARWVDRIELPRRGLPRTPLRYPRGEVFAWRMEAEGRRFHIQGSAGLDEGALARQEPADVLVACLAARHGTPDYLARLGAVLRPSVLLPCHHDDFFRPLGDAPRPVATLKWPAFLRDAAAMEEAWGTRLWCPPRDRAFAW